MTSLVLGVGVLFTVGGVGGNFFVISFQRSKILASLGKFAFLHALADVPVHESSLGVHEVELVGQRGPCLRYCGGVGQDAAGEVSFGQRLMNDYLHSTVDLCEVTIWHHLRRLEADANLESGWAPVDKLDGLLGLEAGYGTMCLLGHNISAVEQACCHIFSIAWVTLDHLVARLKARHGNFLDRVGLIARFCGRNNGRIGHQREMDTWVWYQIGLEFVQIDVQRSIKTERSGD